MIGIYKITSPTGKIYIGQSKNIPDRIKRYKGLRCKKQVRLYASLNKYGFNNHVFEILEECDVSALDCRERYYQDLFDVTGKKGLNCDLVNSGNAPKIKSKETREKISKNHNRFWLGKKFTQEQKNKISEANKGRVCHESTKIKIGLKHKGKIITQEQKDHLRKVNTGKKHSQESINKMSKMVLNTDTGIFYNSVKEAAFTHGINRGTLKARLNGGCRNKTSLIYA